MVMDQVVLLFALRLADVEEMLNSSSSTASASPHTLALLHWQFLEEQKWVLQSHGPRPFPQERFSGVRSHR